MSSAAPAIAETTIVAEGKQVPFPFELRYDAGQIDPTHTYAVRATMSSGGRMMFTTETAAPVITQGNPKQVNLALRRVAAAPGGGAGSLVGTRWRLEDLGGAGVRDRVEATLEFPDAGKVAGGGSCNRFFGSAETSGDSIKLGLLGSTQSVARNISSRTCSSTRRGDRRPAAPAATASRAPTS